MIDTLESEVNGQSKGRKKPPETHMSTSKYSYTMFITCAEISIRNMFITSKKYSCAPRPTQPTD